MKPSHLALLLLMQLFWAGTYSAYKVIGSALPTGGIVTFRFGLAGLCLLLVWPLFRGPAPRGRDFVVSCLMGVTVCVLGQRLQVYSNAVGSASNSSVLIALEPLVTSVAAAIFLREHLGPRRLVGFALGMIGVVLLHGSDGSAFAWGGLGSSLLFVASFATEAAYSIAGKPIVERADPVKMVAISLIFGTLVNLAIDGPATVRAAGMLPGSAWIILVGLAVLSTAVGYVVWFVVIKDCPVNVAALTIFAQSIFGVGFAVLWAGERLHWGQLWGGLAIVVGMVIGLSRQVAKDKGTASALENQWPAPD